MQQKILLRRIQRQVILFRQNFKQQQTAVPQRTTNRIQTACLLGSVLQHVLKRVKHVDGKTDRRIDVKTPHIRLNGFQCQAAFRRRLRCDSQNLRVNVQSGYRIAHAGQFDRMFAGAAGKVQYPRAVRRKRGDYIANIQGFLRIILEEVEAFVVAFCVRRNFLPTLSG